MPIRCRSIFVSDVHLGTRDCQAHYLLDFLRSMQADVLYLVGDIVDLESLARRSHWPAAHGAVLAEILALPARGTRVVYIPGNHDAGLRYLAGQCIGGVEVKLHDEHVGADGRRYRVTHGDEFDGEAATGPLIWLGEIAHGLLLWGNRQLNRLRRRVRLPYLPLAIIVKSRIAPAMRYIDDFETRVAADCKRRGFDGHICGHIHFGNLRDADGVLYLNDGDWVEHCTALVEDFSGAMRLMHWSDLRSELALAAIDTLVPPPALPLAFAPLSSAQVTGARARPLEA